MKKIELNFDEPVNINYTDNENRENFIIDIITPFSLSVTDNPSDQDTKIILYC